MSNKPSIKAIYLQFCGRVVSQAGEKNKHIVAAALYSDKELTHIKGLDVCELTNYEENKQDKYDVYRNRLAEYAAALKMAYKYQDTLLTQGYDIIVLCPSNNKIWDWLQGKKVPTQIKELFENINKQFRTNGPFQLDISVGLSANPTAKKTYKYCREKYLNARLSRVKRGAHIMTPEEIAQRQEWVQNKQLKTEQIEQDKLEENGVSIYDILQEHQGNELEPVIVFKTDN